MGLPTTITKDQVQQLIAKLSPKQLEELDGLLSQVNIKPPKLMQFIPQATPGFDEPQHLKPIIDAVESSSSTGVRLVVSTPVQHGKTESLMAALVHKLLVDPYKRNAYISYSDNRGQEISKNAQWMCDRIGLRYEGTLDKWGLPGQGSIRWTGIGGGLTGAPVDGLMVIDDSTKNREEAESPSNRDSVDSWFRSVALTRLHPGASCIVVQSRWHQDDLAGRLISRGWSSINIPAINDQGKALWEARRPLEWLLEQKRELGEYDWASLYMGQPMARGTGLFVGAPTWSQLPNKYDIAIGTDFAYSKKTASDWSVAVVMAHWDNTWYILDVIRMQTSADVFTKELMKLSTKYPSASIRWDASTTEKGTAEIIRSLGDIPLSGVLAKGDPFQRALRVSSAWNNKRVLVPVQAAWLKDFLKEINSFTGVSDAHDDQVAAMASAFALLPGRIAPPEELVHPAANDPLFRAMVEKANRRAQEREGDYPW